MKTYNLEFTEKDLNTILFALQKQPWEVANEVIQNIVKQVKVLQNDREDNSTPTEG